MDDLGKPANSNIALTDLLRNPMRDLANQSVDQIVTLLEKANLERGQIADVLCEKALNLVVPTSELTSESATVWYAQLQKMRDGFQAQISAIEAELDKI